MPGQPFRRLARVLLAGLFVAAATACASGPAAPRMQDYVNTMLPAGESPGAEILDAETSADATLASWIDEHGRPDYLMPTSARSLLLFDIDRDTTAVVQRPMFASESEPVSESKIRANHFQEFSNADRQRLGDLRRAAALDVERARRRKARDAARRAYFEENPVGDDPANSAPEN